MAEKKKIQFIPKMLADSLRRQIEFSNEHLAALQKHVTEHGEAWPDVLEYAKKGVGYKKQERLAECRAWMDKNNTPSYLRSTMEAEAIADLGADNMRYWDSLSCYIPFRTLNLTSAPILDLAVDVDVSGEVWRVSDSWIKRQEAEFTFTVPDAMAADMERFSELLNILADFGELGYDVSELAGCIKNLADFNNLRSTINPEAWSEFYDRNTDKRVEAAKIE